MCVCLVGKNLPCPLSPVLLLVRAERVDLLGEGPSFFEDKLLLTAKCLRGELMLKPGAYPQSSAFKVKSS